MGESLYYFLYFFIYLTFFNKIEDVEKREPSYTVGGNAN